MLVANSFPNAPSRKATVGVILRFFSSTFFNCSKMVYCRMGLMTSTRAGITPANKAWGPSSLINDKSVPIDVGAFVGVTPSTSLPCFLVVILVLTTQIGFVSRTVAEPAMAPAIIDSTVVSLFEARPALTAAFSKAARVHSYQ